MVETQEFQSCGNLGLIDGLETPKFWRERVMSILRMTALMGALMAGSVAHAQDSTIDFELFRPYSDAYGYLSMPSAATLGHLQVGGAFWFNYSNDPADFGL